MTTPISPSSGQSTSFKTNINRSKTKRWVEAKSYSYDGDDWGDDDEDDYPQQAPPSVGARSHGGFEGPYPQPAGGRYGDASFQPNVPSGMRGVSNPSPGPLRGRSSFDRPDERRTYSLSSQGGFSEGPYPSGGRPPFAPPNPHSPGPRNRTPRNQSPLRVDTGQRRPSMGQDPYPHAPILHDPASGRPQPQFRPDGRGGAYPDVRGGGPYPGPRGGPYPQPRAGPYGDPRGRPVGPYNAPPPGRRSQSNGRPAMSDIRGHSGSPDRGPYAAPPGRPPMPPSNLGSEEGSREPSPAKKFPPRKSSLSQEQAPADIPGISGDNRSSPEVTDGKSATPKALPFIRPADIYRRMEEERERVRRQSEDSNRPNVEALGGIEPPSLRQRGSTDSLGRSAGRHTPDDSDATRRLKPYLGTVPERKSEYGFDNILEGAGPDHPSLPRQSQERQPKEREPESASSTYSNRPDPVTASTVRSQASLGALPEVGRVSDFGDDMFRSQAEKQWSEPASSEAPAPRPPVSDPRRFDSAVNQAFNESQNRGSGTPSSSAANSVMRSNSANTSDISPIISRQSSNAAAESRQYPASVEPTIYEESPDGSMRPDSSGTMVAPPPPPKTSEDDKQLPPPPASGFIRKTDSPSPSGSPARRPLSIATADIATPDVAKVGAPISRSTEKPLPNLGSGSRTPSPVKKSALESSTKESPVPRAESPTKGTVKGLADRFETASGRSSPAGSPERQLDASRPSNSRIESFRPSLPGGWNSYTTNDGKSTPGIGNENTLPKEFTLAEFREQEAKKQQEERAPSLVHTPLPQEDRGPSAKAFAAAAAAGTALAGAFSAAVGTNDVSPSEDSTPLATPRIDTDDDDLSSEAATPDLQSEERDVAYLRPGLDTVREEAASRASSVPPTPPPKDQGNGPKSRLVSNDQSYFPSPLRTGQSRSPDEQLFTPRRPEMTPTLSTETSPQDLESDRLRKEIFKSLTPRTSSAHEDNTPPDGPANSLPAKDHLDEPEHQPTEAEFLNDHQRSMPTVQTHEQETIEAAPQQPERDAPRQKLRKRFSWETESEANGSPVVAEQQPGSVPTSAQSPNPASTPLSSEWDPARSIRGNVPDPIENQAPVASPPEKAVSTSPLEGHEASNPMVEDPVAEPDVGIQPEVRDMAIEQQPIEPTDNKAESHIMPFQSILALKGTADRIKAYNHARTQFASTETGLSEWMHSMGQNQPEHLSMVASNAPFSAKETEEIIGHKVSPSRSKFPRIVSLDASAQQSGDGSSRPTTERPMGERTEQLLQRAEKLGGKAGGMAKGLFAKGKNKFRGSGGGEKAFFGHRRKSQPQVVVTDETPHSRKPSVPHVERSASPVDNASTWSLSYAPTEPNRPSEEKPPLPQQLGSLAPPPYNPSSHQGSQDQSPSLNSLDGGLEQPLGRPVSPHGSALGSTEGQERPSRTVSQMTRPTISDERSPISFGGAPDLHLTLPSPIDGGDARETSEQKAADGDYTGVKQGQTVQNDAVGDHFEDSGRGRSQRQQPFLGNLSTDRALLSQGLEDSSDDTPKKAIDSTPSESRDLNASEAVVPAPINAQSHPGVINEANDLHINQSQLESSGVGPATTEQYQEPHHSIPQHESSHHTAESLAAVDAFREHPPLGFENAGHPSRMGTEPPVLERSVKDDIPVQALHQGGEHSETRSRPFSFVDTDAREILDKSHEEDAHPANDDTQMQPVIDETKQQFSSQKPSRSFSRPFNHPPTQEHPAYRTHLDSRRRSQASGPEGWQSESQYNSMDRPSYVTPRLPTPEEEPYRIPGPYGQSFKSPTRQSWAQAPPPQSRRMSQGYDQDYQNYRQQPSPERTYDPRPLALEYSLPGVEAPPVPINNQEKRRSSLFARSRSRSRPRVPIDDDSDIEVVPRPQMEKRRSGFLRKKRRPISEISSPQQQNGTHGRKKSADAMVGMMSPAQLESPDKQDKKKGKKLHRASTADIPNEKPKRGSFSRLSAFFGKSPKPGISPVQERQLTSTDPVDRREPHLPTLQEQGQQNSGSFPDDRNLRPRSYHSRREGEDGPRGRSQDPESQYPSFSQHQQILPNDRGHGQLPNLRIDTSGNDSPHPNQQRGYHGQGQRPYPNTAPLRGSPYETTKPSTYSPNGFGSGVGLRQESLQHAIDLHKRSRSPMRGRPRYGYDDPEVDHGPASQLGTFTGGSRSAEGQEGPWRLDLPLEEARRRSGYYSGNESGGHDSGVHLNQGSSSQDFRRSYGQDGATDDQQQQQQQRQQQQYQNGQMTATPQHHHHHHHQNHQNHPEEIHELQGSRAANYPPSELSDADDIVMSPTSYPGQEWIPKIDLGRGSSPGLRSWEYLPSTNTNSNVGVEAEKA